MKTLSSRRVKIISAIIVLALALSAFFIYYVKSKRDAIIAFSTEHFDVKLAKQYASYRPLIEEYLEKGYSLYQMYTGYSLNDLMNQIQSNPDVHHPRYHFMFYLPKDMWWKGWKGGLTAWNQSQVAATLLPGLELEEIKKGNPALSIVWHELANGWANVYVDYKGKDTHAPWWFAAEGHAGFLRQHAMVDCGWPVEQVREYKEALKQVDKYLKGEKYDPGSVCHVIVQSLWAEYGWPLFRAIYRAIQEGKLTFSKTDSIQANSVLIRFISETVGKNLLPFFEKFKIKVDKETHEALMKLPTADIPVEQSVLVEKPRHPLK
ncbi:MAG TPA: hypothetical protein EYP60_05430 [bacterium (Candidatus Stahlbacteria)]|nr:hypothetical protein [Candidatus Stahlbacteria bacterium]